MSMLGLKTLPQDHPLHGVYRISAGVMGVLLIGFGAACVLTSQERLLGIGASNRFGALLAAVGLVLIGGALVGGNVAAQLNGHLGAALLVLGLLGLLAQGNDSNVLDVMVSDVILLFVVGMLLLSAGFYGQVAASAPYGDQRGPEHGEAPPRTGEPATGDPMDSPHGPRADRADRR